MTDKLSLFFRKVQAVEESFLQLCELEREKAITILSSSIKKLQTLLGCTITSDNQKTETCINRKVSDREEDGDGDEDFSAFDYPEEQTFEEMENICVKSFKETKGHSKGNKVKKIDKEISVANKKDIGRKNHFLKSDSKNQFCLKKRRKVFHCSECSQTFTHPKSIKNHIEEHGKQPLCCIICRKELYNIVEFQNHDCHEKNKLSSYDKCGKILSDLKTKNHHIKFSLKLKSKKHKCHICELFFVKKSSMVSHLKVHAGDRIVCKKCGQFCDDYDRYSEHIQSHLGKLKYKCEVCIKTFSKKQEYKQHVAGHKKQTCSHCDETFSSKGKLMKHESENHCLDQAVPEDKSHVCDVCGKLFDKPGQLVIHQRLHTGEKPLECTNCQVSFRTKRALLKHKETFSHCIKIGVKKERHFLCSQCGKSFFRKQTLKRHLRCHTGERPHMCQYCGYKTSELNNLKRHVVHHFKGQRNFICEICGDAFHTKKTLESHHIHKHNEDRKFSCSECEMSFKSKSGLNRHSKTHSKSKEHKCWCDAAFGRLYNLRRHMRSVHGNDSALPPVRKIAVLDQADHADEVHMDKSMTEKLEAEKYDQSHLVPTMQQQQDNMMTNCLQMSAETYEGHHNMANHMTLDTQGMVYDNMATAQSIVGYPNTSHVVDVDHQRPPDYYQSNMQMMDNMASAQDYNNPCMYIQNVLLPTVAGLLDLSHAGK